MKLPLLQVLSETEVEEIHQVSLRLLWDLGIRVEDEELRQVLKRAGCKTEEDDDIVCFPSKLVETLLRKIPSSFSVKGYGKNPGLTLGDGIPHFASGMQAVNFFEPGQAMPSPATTREIIDFVRLSEQLETIEMVATPALSQEVDQEISLGYTVREMLTNTSKPLIVAPFVLEDANIILEMMKVVGSGDGGRPRWVCQQSMRSPFCLPSDMAQIMRLVIPAGVPMLYHTAPQTALTAPYTLAGLAVQYNAEMLAAMVSGQAIQPGAPCLYGGGWGTSDMRQLQRCISTPEAALMRIAGRQLSSRYGVPAHCLGPDADSLLSDQQAGWEKMLTALASVGAGVDLQPNAGMVGTGMNLSLAQLIMDSEILEIAKAFFKNIKIDKDHLAEDIIRHVGHKRDYISHKQTLDRMLHGDEYRKPNLFSSAAAKQKQTERISSASERALDIAKSMIARSGKPILTLDKQKKLDEVLLRSCQGTDKQMEKM